MSHLRVSVNETHEFEFSDAEISEFDSLEVSKNKFHVLDKHRSFSAEISEAHFNSKTYQVKVNNNRYSVTIENDLDQLIKDMGFELSSSQMVSDIKAPMPGLVLEISVKEGQEVKENDTLLILEAMKMENVLTSPRDGVIKSISVAKGDAVDKNQLLLDFE